MKYQEELDRYTSIHNEWESTGECGTKRCMAFFRGKGEMSLYRFAQAHPITFKYAGDGDEPKENEWGECYIPAAIKTALKSGKTENEALRLGKDASSQFVDKWK